MYIFRNLLASVMLLLLTTAFAIGQTKSKHKTAKPSCSVGSLVFRCPSSSRIIPITDEPTFALFRSTGSDTHDDFFVPLAPATDEAGFMANITARILAKLLPNEKKPFEWKPTSGLDKVSKYEIGGGGWSGFNGTQAVVSAYRRVKFKDQEFLVGSVFASGRGKEAKDNFDQGSYGISMDECNSAVEVIFSITGETIDKNNAPCELKALIQ
jgi:hypothetical protein